MIPISLSLFNWAKFRTKKCAIKLHAVLDYDTGLPNFAVITDGKTHDIEPARKRMFPAESVLVVDRGYIDYECLNNLVRNQVLFFTRLKSYTYIEILTGYPV